MNRMNMMEQVHLAGEDEDDIYGGFNDYNATLDVDDLQHDTSFQKAVMRTSHGRRPPPTAARGLGGVPGTAARGRMGMPSSMGRLNTGAVGGGQDMARPMTAVRGAGYTSAGNRAAGFDPMNQAGPAPPLEPKPEETPEEKIRQLEKKVNELIEESCFANSTGDLSLALEKAKEAGRKERVLVRQREQQSMGDQINLDLTYSVLFNLANQYAANEMFNEALNTYQVIVKNKMFTNAAIFYTFFVPVQLQWKYDAENCIKTAAKIISPAIEAQFSLGYDRCTEQVKSSQYLDLAHDLEIDKAIMFLKEKDFNQAIETLKSFEKKDTKVASTAATNLSFLYFLENDLEQADKYAELAMSADRYNPAALVNKGNVLYARGDYEKAREFYKEALQNDSSCVEGLYNLGLTNKKISRLEDALDCFYKLHAILRNSPQVMYQIADLHDQLEDTAQATEWFMQLIGVAPTDPSVLARTGEIYDNEGDK
ncbi:intraflagellar transport protein 88 homolog, partial [Saccostrea cucullata]|uniref:intraflagellar transport protein 88 homolog n=1 Tax=Saccostrea cuccullata TaxID=36930 RepID=UPI002ED23C9E